MTRWDSWPGGHWNTWYVPKRIRWEPMLSDRDAEPPAPEGDGERREGRGGGDDDHQPEAKAEPPPAREDEPGGVEDQHVLQDPRVEGVLPDADEPARGDETELLEARQGAESRSRDGHGQGDEAARADQLVEGDARPEEDGRERARREREDGGAESAGPPRRWALEPPPDEQTPERERHEGESGDRPAMHLAVPAPREERQEPDRERRQGGVRGGGEERRQEAALGEGLEDAPARLHPQRPDAVEEHAQGEQQREAPHGLESRGRRRSLPGPLAEIQDERDADQELEHRGREVERPEDVALVVAQPRRHVAQEDVQQIREQHGEDGEPTAGVDEREPPGRGRIGRAQRPCRARKGRTAATNPAGLSPMTEWPAPRTSATSLPGSSRVKRLAVSAARIGLSEPRTSSVGHRIFRTASQSRSKSASSPPLPIAGSNL